MSYKFTGKERDSESGLDYFGARYDASSMGRFMTPDPLGGHQEDPQTLNKYAYVRNNPTTLTDPTGLDFNLNCDKNNGTTCQGGHQYYQDKNGDYKETVVKSDDKGNLTDQSGNKYSGTFDGKNVTFSNGRVARLSPESPLLSRVPRPSRFSKGGAVIQAMRLSSGGWPSFAVCAKVGRDALTNVPS